MAIVIKLLAADTIPSATKDIYTVPDGKSAIVNSVRLVNGNASPSPTMNIFVKPSGAATVARRIHDNNFTIGAGGSLVLSDALTLGQGDKIQLTLNSVQTINYSVHGIEKE